MKKLVTLLLSLALAASIAGCASTGSTATTAASTKASAAGTTTSAASGAAATAAGTTTASAATTAAATAATQKVFTLAELQTFDGQNGNLAYVAVSGVVYDITNAKGWSKGAHQGLTAGQDLTTAITSAPHGTSVLSGLTIVGTLA